MRAMALTGINEMEMIEVESPRIENDSDVLLRLSVVGVCGSDVHYYETGRIGDQIVEYPYRVGHECSAVVEAVGPAVKNLEPGDIVAVDPAMWCGECDQCVAERFHTCRNLRFLGCPGQAEGCLSDYLVMPEHCCFKLPEGMDAEDGALSEPLSIGYYAVQQSVPMEGARIAILGSGPIGLSVMIAAKYKGAAKIYMTDKIDDRVEMATQHGADWAGNPDKTDVVADITEAEPLLLDAVFECAGQPETIDQGISLLKPGGKLMLIGIPRSDRVSFDINVGRRREICIQNVRRQNECVLPTVEMMGSGKAPVEFMVTHRFPFEKSKEAFDLVAGYKDGVVKAMIHFDQ